MKKLVLIRGCNLFLKRRQLLSSKHLKLGIIAVVPDPHELDMNAGLS